MVPCRIEKKLQNFSSPPFSRRKPVLSLCRCKTVLAHTLMQSVAHKISGAFMRRMCPGKGNKIFLGGMTL